MEVQLNLATSNLNVTDSHTLLNPTVMEQVVREAVRRIRAEMEKEKRVQQETGLRPGVSARQTSNWG
jgi:hypothetical protein